MSLAIIFSMLTNSAAVEGACELPPFRRVISLNLGRVEMNRNEKSENRFSVSELSILEDGTLSRSTSRTPPSDEAADFTYRCQESQDSE